MSSELLRVPGQGVPLAVERRGRGGRPLLLVHGFTGFRQDFATQLPALAGSGPLLAPDLRGHGVSGRAGDASGYTLEALVDDLLALLDALEIERCDLLGHSMGGMAALRFALAHPERVASLVLMDTAARAPEGIDPTLAARAGEVARQLGMVELAKRLREHAAADPGRGEADRRLEAEWGPERFWAWRNARLEAMDPVAYGAFAQALFGQQPVAARLGEIACPTLVQVGELDRDFRSAAEELAAGIPGARLAVLPRAGHQPQHEAPEAWRETLLAHLRAARQA